MQKNNENIAIVDYDCGNLGSILNMFKRIGVPAYTTRDPKEIEKAQKILLPGVGAFDQCMNNLNKYGFTDILNHKALIEKIPILGICVGFQMMSHSSEEGKCPGLGWIDGNTVDMRKYAKNTSNASKFPHIGWNYLNVLKPHYLLQNKHEEAVRFYFVHTYHMICNNQENLLATTQYQGISVTASAGKDNIIGTQFHPEKSHKFGIELFKNFAEWKTNS